jgi:hypothetical protein
MINKNISDFGIPGNNISSWSACNKGSSFTWGAENWTKQSPWYTEIVIIIIIIIMQLFIYLHAEHNCQQLVTKSARIQTTKAERQHRTKKNEIDQLRLFILNVNF